MRVIDHFIAGGAPTGERRLGDVFDPNNGGVQAQVRLGTAADVDLAVEAALAAQPAWAAANPQRRARVMFRFRELVEAEMDSLARVLASEHGKVVSDARGEIQRGLDVIEFCCGIPHALKGEYSPNASAGIDVFELASENAFEAVVPGEHLRDELINRFAAYTRRRPGRIDRRNGVYPV